MHCCSVSLLDFADLLLKNGSDRLGHQQGIWACCLLRACYIQAGQAGWTSRPARKTLLPHFALILPPHPHRHQFRLSSPVRTQSHHHTMAALTAPKQLGGIGLRRTAPGGPLRVQRRGLACVTRAARADGQSTSTHQWMAHVCTAALAVALAAPGKLGIPLWAF